MHFWHHPVHLRPQSYHMGTEKNPEQKHQDSIWATTAM
jgi:hypothetical protein